MIDTPAINWHALAPDLILGATIVVVLVADLLFRERQRFQTSRIASIGVLAALIPVITLWIDDESVSQFGGTYVVDRYALAFKAFFILTTYVTLLISVDYIEEGDYYRGEYYFLLLTSVFGMSVMASARDLITIFVALETISIPTFVLAAFRKHDRRSNEAGIKYYVIGVLSSAIMLYGMSIVYGLTGSTLLTDIVERLPDSEALPLAVVAIFLTLVGFAFKISAVPFHFWAPDTYEGAPTPVSAFLSVASKAGGFVALTTILYIGFAGNTDAWQPIVWVLAALSMFIGNLTALRQTNIVRMLAYSSVAQGGFILVPLAVAPDGEAAASALEAVVIYLLIYAVMNLGAFGVVIAVARRTGTAEIDSYAGLARTSPGLALMMALFMFSLAGIPPLAGWFAKFVMFRAVLDAGTAAAIVLGAIAAVNSVIAFFYYGGVARRMYFDDPADADASPIRVPAALQTALVVTIVLTVVVGVYPQLFARVGELAEFAIG